MSTKAPDTATLAALLDQLVPLGGLSGHESEIAATLRDEFARTATEVHTDRLGNVIARYGTADAPRTIAVLAHMDTVGLMVKQVDAANGILRVMPVGGVNVLALPGTTVELWRYDAATIPTLPGIPGVIGVRSQHLAQSGDAPRGVEDLYVQVDPALAGDIRITTPITYAPQITRQGDLYSSPHLDDRAGCAVLVALAHTLGDRDLHDCAITLIGSVQEETTCAGALAALNEVQPDAAIFVDGTLSYDTPDTRGKGPVALGSGPVLTSFLYVSGLNGWHADPRLRAHLSATASLAQIPYQEDAIRGLMSDARTATMLGIPSAIVGIPMRGKHSSQETLHLGDLARSVDLLGIALSDPHFPA